MCAGSRSLLFVAVICVLGTFRVDAGPSGPLAGQYAVTELARSGDEVLLTLTLRLVNESERDVSHARVTVDRRDADERPLDVSDRMLGAFEDVTVHAQNNARVTQRFVVPFAEYVAWTEGQGPRLRLAFDDENGETVETSLTLDRVGDISRDPLF
jgi:hypothetical protein